MEATNDNIKRYLLESYDAAFKRFGDDPRSVKWNSRESQEKRFHTLAEIGDLSGATILDVGCGKADFYGYLYERGIHTQYTGIDINPAFIEFARKKYPDAKFEVLDIGERLPDNMFDFIFLCGIFSELYPKSFIRETISKTFQIAKISLGFNLISTYSIYRVRGFRYESPEDTFRFCMKNLSEYITLRHDYMNENFTIFVYRESSLKLK